MSTLLLISHLPIPPSVNRRTAISARGGYDTPATRQYKHDVAYILMSDETYRVREDIERARLTNAFLSMTMIFYLPEAKNPKRKGSFFLGRDLDNMVQLVQNAVTQHLEIDDVMVIVSHIYKLPLPPTEPGYAHVTVSSISLINVIHNAREQEIVNEDTIAPIHQTGTAATTNALQSTISQALSHIESAIASDKSRGPSLGAGTDA